MENERVQDLVRLVFLQFSALLLILFPAVLLGPFPFLAPRLPWVAAAWLLLAGLHIVVGRLDLPRGQARVGFGVGLPLILALLVAWLLRVLPYRWTRVPLGYDYGFYAAAMSAAAEAGRLHEAPLWVMQQFPPGLLVLQQALAGAAGLSPSQHLLWLFPVLSVLPGLLLFVWVRARFGDLAALLAVVFFAVAFTPFEAFRRLYEKNLLALMLAFVTALLVERRQWALAGVVVGSVGALHRPTFLLLAAALAVAAVGDVARNRTWHRASRWALAAGLSLAVVVPVWLRFPETFWALLRRSLRRAAEAGAAAPSGEGGSFFDSATYLQVALPYLVLAVASGLLLLRRGRGGLVQAMFVLAGVNVLLQYLFWRRYIIMLDLAALALVGVFVAAVVRDLLARPHVLEGWLGRVDARRFVPWAVAPLVVLSLIPTVEEAWAEPRAPVLFVGDEARLGVHWIRDNVPTDAVALGDNLAGPMVAAESGHRTFAPGLFDDEHKADEWQRFMGASGGKVVDDHLAAYDADVVVFHAFGNGPGLGIRKFSQPPFNAVYDSGAARVWATAGMG